MTSAYHVIGQANQAIPDFHRDWRNGSANEAELMRALRTHLILVAGVMFRHCLNPPVPYLYPGIRLITEGV